MRESIQKLRVVSRQAHFKENPDGRIRELKPLEVGCKCHVVFIPKCRRKVLYESLRVHLGEVFRKLAEQKESRIEEGHLLADHVHMMISIPPKYAVSQVVGFIKGKSAIHLARVYGERRAKLLGARVLCVDRRPGRGNDSGVHTQPGDGRSPLKAEFSLGEIVQFTAASMRPR